MERLALPVGVTDGGKSTINLECEIYQTYAPVIGLSVPQTISINDLRNIFWGQLLTIAGLTKEDNFIGDFNQLFNPDIFVPLKYTDGDNTKFHCAFNWRTYDEITKEFSDEADNSAIGILHTGGKTYLAINLPSVLSRLWTQTFSAFTNMGTFTARWYGYPNNSGAQMLMLSNNGGLTSEGTWAILRETTDAIAFYMHDGTSLKSITSDAATHDGSYVDVSCIVDTGNVMKMYIDGVLQADTQALAKAPDYLATGEYGVGGTIAGLGARPFKGTLVEAKINEDRITP